MTDPADTVLSHRNPRIGRWPDEEFYRQHGFRRWYAMFPNTPGAYTPCDSWCEALAVVAKWYARRLP